MAVRFRAVSAVLASLAMAVAACLAATSASAAPYTRQPTLSINTQCPALGASVVLTGTGYVPGIGVTLTLHTATYTLGSVTPDASGGFTKSVALPAGVSGAHTVVGTGAAASDTASVNVTIGNTCGGGGGTTTGGLSSTGVAVIGIGSVGLALLVGGATLLLAGRRRKVTA